MKDLLRQSCSGAPALLPLALYRTNIRVADAEKWSEIIRHAAGATGPATPGLLTAGSHGSEPSSPISPTMEKGRVVSQPPTYTEGSTAQAPTPINTSGLHAGETVQTPTSPATPHTLGDKI